MKTANYSNVIAVGLLIASYIFNPTISFELFDTFYMVAVSSVFKLLATCFFIISLTLFIRLKQKTQK